MDIFTILKMIALSGILKSVVTAALSYITQFLITASHAVFLRLMLIEAVYVLARGRIFITLTWRYSGNMKINGSMEGFKYYANWLDIDVVFFGTSLSE